MISFVIIVLVLNTVLVDRLISQVDKRLRQRLTIAEQVLKSGTTPTVNLITAPGGDQDDDAAPLFIWMVNSDGLTTVLSGAAPLLPRRTWAVKYSTSSIGTSTFRFDAASFKKGRLIVGESLADILRLRSTLELAELIAGVVLMILMFGAALVVGIRALAPVSLAKRRQSEFVADASHELRTPLSVIEAEVGLALSRDRDAASYRTSLEHVKGEGRRLRNIVEDLLWLARADESQKRQRPLEPTDVRRIAAAGCERFDALARSNETSLVFSANVDEGPVISASDEMIDRLLGVLVDNALKFAGHGGRVEVSVISDTDNVTLRVDDNGPGIASEDRTKVFERFHHSDSTLGGTGLGLAIAASIIQVSDATCAVGIAEIGGARFDVTWHIRNS
jgi:signal transduction histidine kinase